MARFLSIGIFLIAVSLLTAFAPVEIENIPPEIIESKIDYYELPVEYSEDFGLTQQDFVSKRMRFLVNPFSDLPYQIISSGLRVAGYNAITDDNIEAFSRDFIRLYPELAGVPNSALRLYRAEFIQNRWYITFWQYNGDTRFYDSRLELRISPDARVFYLRSGLVDGEPKNSDYISTDEAQRVALAFLGFQDFEYEFRDEGMVVLPVVELDEYVLHYGRQFSLFAPELPADFFFVVSSGGEVLRFNNRLTTATGTVRGPAYPLHLETPIEEFPWADALYMLDGSHGFTNRDGGFSGSSGSGDRAFFTRMAGRWCEIDVHGGSHATRTEFFSGSSFDFRWHTGIARMDEMNVYYHVTTLHNYIKDVFRYDGMDYVMVATVGQSFDNAYFDGRNINMGAGVDIFHNLAYFADIIQHEYHHGVTRSIYGRIPGIGVGMGLAMNEAFSDYFPCAMNNDPFIGNGGLYRDGTRFMRTVSNTRRYPEDYINQPHYDGQILSGSLWDLRNMIDPWITDSLAFFARFGHPLTFEEFLVELLICDDDDGDITTGTNNGWDIVEAFFAHGIGPGSVSLTHEPISMSDDTIGSYLIYATLNSYFDLSESVPVLTYILGYTDTHTVVMANDDGVLTAHIPARSHGERIFYNIAVDVDDARNVSSPEGAPFAWHNFRIAPDNEPPTLIHTPTEFRSQSTPLFINAMAYDNQGINDVIVQWRHNSLTKPDIIMSYDGTAHNYYTYLTGRFRTGDIIEYRIVATDVSMAAHTTSSPESGWHIVEVESGFYDQVGPEDYLWTTYPIASGFVNQWHKTVSEDYTGTGGYSFKFGSEGGFDYANAAEGALEFGPIMLEGTSSLSFWHRIDAELDTRDRRRAWDGGVIEISAGYGWSRLAPMSGWYTLVRNEQRSFYPGGGIRVYSGTHGWQQEVIDLSDLEGWIYFRFRFGTDLYVTGEGWYIDDIRIQTDYTAIEFDNGRWTIPDELSIEASPNPFNSSTRLSFVSDGSDAKIEIFDINGKIIESFEMKTNIGINSVTWVADDYNSGVYIGRLTTGNNETSVKMMYIK